MYVQVFRQAGPGTSAEIHPNIKTVRLYRQRQGLLRVSDKLAHLQHLFVGGLVKVGDVSGRSYQEVAVVVGEMIQYHQAKAGTPQHKILVVLFGSGLIMTYETVAALVQTLHVSNPPRRP
jgi:hypothetical protein